MSFDIIEKNFIISSPKLDENEITGYNFFIKKSTGERIAKVFTEDATFIKTISSVGVRTSTCIEIPEWETRDERDEIILDLLKQGHIQDDIADYMDISQGTISRVKKKYSK